MTALHFIFRILLETASSAVVQEAFSQAGSAALTAAKRQIVKEVENGISRWEKKRTVPTMR